MLKPTPQGDLIRGRALGELLGHVDEALMNGISAIITEAQELPGHLCHVRTLPKGASYEPGSGLYQMAPWHWTSSL